MDLLGQPINYPSSKNHFSLLFLQANSLVLVLDPWTHLSNSLCTLKLLKQRTPFFVVTVEFHLNFECMLLVVLAFNIVINYSSFSLVSMYAMAYAQVIYKAPYIQGKDTIRYAALGAEV